MLYLVWIPRYEYRINYFQNNVGQMDIKFISITQTSADAGYMVHPAFKVDLSDEKGPVKQISGIWVSKFEATDIN